MTKKDLVEFLHSVPDDAIISLDGEDREYEATELEMTMTRISGNRYGTCSEEKESFIRTVLVIR